MRSPPSPHGLGNYDAGKADGSAYPQGTVTNSWKSYTLSMDRGVKFSLDRTDPNDTGFLVTAENVIREFARNALVKEQDTYVSTACTIWPTATRPTIPPTSLRRPDQDQRPSPPSAACCRLSVTTRRRWTAMWPHQPQAQDRLFGGRQRHLSRHFLRQRVSINGVTMRT